MEPSRSTSEAATGLIASGCGWGWLAGSAHSAALRLMLVYKIDATRRPAVSLCGANESGMLVLPRRCATRPGGNLNTGLEIRKKEKRKRNEINTVTFSVIASRRSLSSTLKAKNFISCEAFPSYVIPVFSSSPSSTWLTWKRNGYRSRENISRAIVV